MKKNLSSLCILIAFLVPSTGFSLEVAGFTFNPPAKWVSSQPTSNMRKAQFEATSQSNEKAEIAFFHFGSSGAGGIQANVDRWMKQFEDPQGKSVETETFGEISLTFAQAHGTFLSGRPFGPKTPNPDYALAAAIIDGPAGAVFVKMTGPKAAVDEHSEALRKMVREAIGK